MAAARSARSCCCLVAAASAAAGLSPSGRNLRAGVGGHCAHLSSRTVHVLRPRPSAACAGGSASLVGAAAAGAVAATAAAAVARRGSAREGPTTTVDDLRRLRELIAEGRLLHPLGAPANFADVARALASCCGQHPAGAPGREEQVQAIADQLGGTRRRHIVFVLCDGMGNAALEQNLDVGSFLRSRNDPDRLRAVFPATTPAALTTLATGVWRGEHGVAGWALRDQKACEFPGEPAEHVQLTVLHPFVVDRRTDRPAAEFGYSDADVYFVPPWTSLGRSTRQALFVNAYAGTDFTNWYKGPHDSHFEKIPETAFETLGTPEGSEQAVAFFRRGIDAVLEGIRQAEEHGFQAYVYLYTAHPDKHMHALGVEHTEVRNIMRGFDRELSRLWAALEGTDTAVLVTADHGHVTVRPEEMIELPDDVLACLEYANVGVHGTGRHGFLHCRAGLRWALERCWAQHPELRDNFLLLSIEDAAAEGLFGPGGGPPPSLRPRLGDYVAVSLCAATLVSSREAGTWRHGPGAACQGGHGSLTPDELRIPFVLCTPEQRAA